MAGERYAFSAELWRWEARSEDYVLARLPEDVSAEVRDTPRPRAGFGAVRVRVALGGSRWSTSVFPDAATGTYVLPVKRAVRAAEGVDVGDVVAIEVETLG